MYTPGAVNTLCFVCKLSCIKSHSLIQRQRERDGGFRVIALAMTGHLRLILYTHKIPPSHSDCCESAAPPPPPTPPHPTPTFPAPLFFFSTHARTRANAAARCDPTLSQFGVGQCSVPLNESLRYSSIWHALKKIKKNQNEAQSACAKSTHKGVNPFTAMMSL